MLWPIACLLMSAKLISPLQNTSKEIDYQLDCVNDYLYTIKCSLTIPPTDKQPDNSSYWLEFKEDILVDGMDELQSFTHNSTLSYADGYSGSYDRRDLVTSPETILTFQRDDKINISLCHKVDRCVSLKMPYSPYTNIKPIAPSKPLVVLNSSQVHFSWNSSYDDDILLDLKYELQMDRKNEEKLVSQNQKSFTADIVGNFAPDTEYMSRVRSAPGGYYMGRPSEWSPWSPWKTGNVYQLDCVNDYLYTIKCSLTIPPTDKQPDKSSYWLEFKEDILVDGMDELQSFTHNSTLSYADGYSGSYDRRDLVTSPETVLTFQMDDKINILLCHKVDRCVSLKMPYSPYTNIKPIAPSKPLVVLNSSQVDFSWNSSYEEHDILLDLKYELQMDRKNEEKLVSQNQKSFTADIVGHFAPDTEYMSRVRSAPGGYYMGRPSEWSPWSPWKTEKATRSVHLYMLIIFSASVVLLFSCIPILKLRHTFIPTPVLHDSPPPNNYQGGVKSWVATPSVYTDLFKTENTAQIDVLAESVDVPAGEDEEWLRGKQGTRQVAPHGGGGGGGGGGSSSSLCVPYAVTPVPDAETLPLWDAESSAEWDSGCCLCSVTPDGDHRGYRNAYCTLSDMQCGGTLDHDGPPGPGSDPAAATAAARAQHAGAKSFYRKADVVDYQNEGQQLSLIH